MTPRHIIVDSSIAIKWYLPDEYDDKASKIKSDFADGSILIAIPLLFFYEVSNIFRTTSRSLRIAKGDAIRAYQDILLLNFMTYSSKELFKSALEKSLEREITAYDASYIVLAEYLEVPFYTADEKLVKKAKSSLVKNLSDYFMELS